MLGGKAGVFSTWNVQALKWRVEFAEHQPEKPFEIREPRGKTNSFQIKTMLSSASFSYPGLVTVNMCLPHLLSHQSDTRD